MNIIGLNMTPINPAACLIQDDRLIAFAEEERFIGFKNAWGQAPRRSLEYCLKEGEISVDEIDLIAVGWNANKYNFKMPLLSARLGLKYCLRGGVGGGLTGPLVLLENLPWHQKYKILMLLRSLGLRKRKPRIEFFNHHECHAASAYYCSGMEEAVILVLDGSGEDVCASMFFVQNNDFRLIKSISLPNSLGWFYSGFTEWLGFEPYEGEYKVMGMAPYGSANEEVYRKLRKVIKIFSDRNYEIDPSFFILGKHNYGVYFSDRLVELFGPPHYPGKPYTKKDWDIAYAVQDCLEKACFQLVKEITREGRHRNLCLAGGAALNCKMAGKVLQSKYVDNVFVQPASYDSGTALGAALVAARMIGGSPFNLMEHTYYGPAFSNNEVEKILSESKVNFKLPKNLIKYIARKLADGKIVGWFQGRMEAGPRALGNRSILAKPFGPEMKDVVNFQIKHREQWRPFAPSILDEDKEKILKEAKNSPFMTFTFEVADKAKEMIPAVVHIDGTTRPQTVLRNTNEKYWHLIKEFFQLTGVPALLNTSFNIKGRPIVCAPVDALKCFFSTGLDVLVIEDYVIEK